MSGRTKLIMEVADNHGGDVGLARTFIRVAAGLRVDYVKFQSWQLARVRDPGKEPFYEWLKKAELTDDLHRVLVDECRKEGVKFLTTVFDRHRIDFLASLGLDAIKVASPDLCNFDLLGRVKDRFPHLIISTGMHHRDEIAKTAEFLKGTRFTFMHCVSLYPHGLDSVNLARIPWLRQFTPSVGYSDHSDGIEASKIAVAMGADYVERHTCLSRYGPGRVNAWDTTPDKWEELAQYARRVGIAMGRDDAALNEKELAARERFIGRWSGGG